MQNTANKTRKTPRATSIKQSPVSSDQKTNQDSPIGEAKHTPDEKKSYQVKKTLDPNMYITVKNGFNGTLVYKSKKTGERFIWQSFGDEQEMELSELKSAKNTSKAFFVNNWFLIDDLDVIDWLGMTKYYKHALNSKSFDDLFKKSPDEIEHLITGLSSGQKKSVAFRAKQLIADGVIDSIKVINALEAALSIELIER